MNNNKIGIKLADGTFFPILSEGIPSKKALELTTVRDNQTTVQVNLYKSASNSITETDYVDTLLIANLVPHQKGDPTISLTVSIDEHNVLSAQATDTESGESSNITVSLVNLQSQERPLESDFSLTRDLDFLDEEPLPEIDFDSNQDDLLPSIDDLDFSSDSPIKDGDFDFDIDLPDSKTKKTAEAFSNTVVDDFDYLNESIQKPENKMLPVIICTVCALICICALGVTAYLFFSKSQFIVKATPPETVYVIETQQEKPSEAVEDKIVVVEEPIVVPVAPQVSAANTQEVQYKIKWGDTLWDISNAYYKTPWLYKKIAQRNNIKNPDYIISGTWISIPPK